MYLIQHNDGRTVDLNPLKRYRLCIERLLAHRFYTRAEAQAVIDNCFDRDPSLSIVEAPGVAMFSTRHGKEITVPTAPMAPLPSEWSSEDILKREA